MANLTRIKNNQITDSTILANTKIVPGSIVGSLFNSNLTMSSDVTITGNLTVQGTSTYLTVASTNTYVNDPLIVLNNAFTGTNTYDVGMIFNRGNQTSAVLVYSESADEFRLGYTSNVGALYGAVVMSNYGNLHVGNLTIDSALTTGSLSTTSMTLSGDLAVNGGDITSTASTFNLLNSLVTTANILGSATTINFGASTGLTAINNNLTVANILYVNAGIASTSTTTGTMVVNGGVGLSGNIYAGRSIVANNGVYSANIYNGSYTGGIVIDYNTGMGRISVGSNDGLTIYNSGIANVALVTVHSNGNVGISGNLTSGNISTASLVATNLTGTLLTAAQTNITSVGNLSALAASGTIQTTGIVYANSTAASTSTTTGALVVNGGVGVSGNINAGNVTVTNLTGTLLTAAQTNITSLGNLSALAASGTIQTTGRVYGNSGIGGTLLTAAQTNITSVGNLSALAASGTIQTTGIVYGNSGVSGTLLTAAQTNITSVGNLSSLASSGTIQTTGIVYANANISSTSTTTGALLVRGGVGVTGNIQLGLGANINVSQSSDFFRVNGKFTSLIYADSNTGAVIIGGANTTVQGGTTLKVSGTGAMMIPVGTAGQRPGLTGNVDVAGMLRFNTSISMLEFYDGTAWQTTQGGFTVIAVDSYTADGTANVFTMSGASTTNATVVAINGVVQAPILAYSVSGTSLTFTENPAAGDLIDVRRLTTTATVSSIINNTSSISIDSNAYGNALVNITGNVISTTTAQGVIVNGNVSATNFVGNGALLTGIVASSSYGNAQVASYLPTYTGSFGNLASGITSSGTIQTTGIVYGNSGIGGTLLTAAQTNITSVGTLTSLGVSGAITVNSGNNATAIVNGGTAGAGNIGASGAGFNTVFAKATTALYADLAEKYLADNNYEPGTVLEFGGLQEVTKSSTPNSNRVAGIVSTNPAYLMNDSLKGEYVVSLALTGRVPCKVYGPVSKGDMMVSAGNGFAKSEVDPKIGTVIGKAIQNFNELEGVIEVVVGRL